LTFGTANARTSAATVADGKARTSANTSMVTGCRVVDLIGRADEKALIGAISAVFQFSTGRTAACPAASR